MVILFAVLSLLAITNGQQGIIGLATRLCIATDSHESTKVLVSQARPSRVERVLEH